MYFEEPGWPLIDEFFAALAEGRSTTTVRRYGRVRGRLVAYLDLADMSWELGEHPAMLLDAEREFHHGGAFWALFGAEELLLCLPGFLRETWMPDSDGEARTQISVVSQLMSHLVSEHVRGSSCAALDAMSSLRSAAAQARRRLDERAGQQADDQQMPARFRQPPGPEW